MKKIIYSFCFTFIALGCASDDDSDDINPDDLDGDGVTNQREVIDGTDPENPCDYVLSNMFFPDSTSQWRNLDCDGDGVTNGNELDPDGNNAVDVGWITNPQDGCELRVPKQTVTPSPNWQTGDCDDDSFSNAQEVTDDTDLNDPCSFILGNQDLESTVTFRRGDCDEDGRTNIEEIIEGTDIFDASDPHEDGTIISEIILSYSYLDEIPFKSIKYKDNGTNLDEIREEGVLKTKFHFDANNRLSLVEKFSSPTLTVNYEFFYDVQNRVNSVTITTNDNGQVSSETSDYVYENNFINYYENGNLKRSIILNTNNKVTNIYFYSPYYDINLDHNRLKFTYQYYDITENIDVFYERNEFWNSMYSYYYTNDDTFWSGFRYDDNRPNYFLDAYENIYFNYILAPDIFEFHFYMEEIGAIGLFENNFQTSFSRGNSEFLYNSFELTDYYYQENGFPFTARGETNSAAQFYGRKVYFFFE